MRFRFSCSYCHKYSSISTSSIILPLLILNISLYVVPILNTQYVRYCLSNRTYLPSRTISTSESARNGYSRNIWLSLSFLILLAFPCIFVITYIRSRNAFLLQQTGYFHNFSLRCPLVPYPSTRTLRTEPSYKVIVRRCPLSLILLKIVL